MRQLPLSEIDNLIPRPGTVVVERKQLSQHSSIIALPWGHEEFTHSNEVVVIKSGVVGVEPGDEFMIMGNFQSHIVFGGREASEALTGRIIESNERTLFICTPDVFMAKLEQMEEDVQSIGVGEEKRDRQSHHEGPGRVRDSSPARVQRGRHKGPPVSVLDGLKDVDKEGVRLISRVVRMISYTELMPAADEEGNVPDNVISVELFQKLRGLAVVDVMTEAPNAEKAESVGCSVNHLTKLRKMPEYGEMRDLVIMKLQSLANATTMGKASSSFEPMMVEETLDSALFGSGASKTAAIASLVDRSSSRKGRGSGEVPHDALPVTETLLQAMATTMELANRLMGDVPKDITPPRGDVLQLPDGGTYDGQVETDGE